MAIGWNVTMAAALAAALSTGTDGIVRQAKAQPGTAGIPLELQQAQYCSAYTPIGWSFLSNPQGSTAESVSPQRTQYAGWGVTAVDRQQQPFMHPNIRGLYGDPETSMRYLTNLILAGTLGDQSGMRYSSSPHEFLGYFEIRSFTSAGYNGIIFYKIYQGLTPTSYVESAYWAIASKSLGEVGLAEAAGVTASIRCVTQLVPRQQSARRGTRAGCGYGGNLRGYNKELGTQWAHSPSTGRNYLLDRSTQWREIGPDGPGYYVPSGNSYEKLEPGFSDDC